MINDSVFWRTVDTESWSIINTMKYSHFAPEHLEDAVKLNTLIN